MRSRPRCNNLGKDPEVTDTEIVLNVAAKAVIVNTRGQILILRESGQHATNTKVGRYQLPGGRIEKGEAFFDGLRREVHEETGLQVIPGEPLLVGEWRPVVLGVPHQIVGIFLTCTLRGGDRVRLSEEHDGALWIDPKEYKEYDIVEPDCDAIERYASMPNS